MPLDFLAQSNGLAAGLLTYFAQGDDEGADGVQAPASDQLPPMWRRMSEPLGGEHRRHHSLTAHRAQRREAAARLRVVGGGVRAVR